VQQCDLLPESDMHPTVPLPPVPLDLHLPTHPAPPCGAPRTFGPCKRPITADPDAPQEEREDLLDVLAQELASAVHTELRGRTYSKVRGGLYQSDLS
jgi:hypothetical protein